MTVAKCEKPLQKSSFDYCNRDLLFLAIFMMDISRITWNLRKNTVSCLIANCNQTTESFQKEGITLLDESMKNVMKTITVIFTQVFVRQWRFYNE